MTSISTILGDIKNRPALLSFLLIATLVASLCFAFMPRWASNDDAVMSMIAHGYGTAAHGSTHLVMSNVLWGYLVRAIPSINGVLGYSIATLAVLVVAGWTILYFLLRLGAGYLVGLLAVALLIARPTVFPQYTINAGLLTIAAIIGWQVYARLGGIGYLVAASLLAFFGYLIRDKEFFLVLAVALPLLPWRALLDRRQMQTAFLLLGLAIIAATVFDRWSYSAHEWRLFLEISPDWTPFADFVDYGAGELLKRHPEILARHGYSPNDINLISNWFFADPHIANPKSLNSMLAELGPRTKLGFQSGLAGIKALFDPVLIPMLLLALLILALIPRWKAAIAWVIFLAALFAVGAMGRPGILRIYVPLLGLLLFAPLVIGKFIEGSRQKIAAMILFAACIGNAYTLTAHALISRQWIQQIQIDIHGFPIGPIVSWGQSFPFELAYPVLGNNIDSRNIRFYGLAFFSHAPFSVARTEQMAGRGVLERLRSQAGIPIIASPEKLEMLSLYCAEHLNVKLQGVIKYQTSWITIQQARCVTDQ
jgi:hypothetical protein